jgi:hydrogenase/urease accessory protein HupE
LVALNIRLRTPWVLGLVGVSGLLRGYSNSGTATADWLSLVGGTTTIFILVTLSTALVVSLRAYWTRIAVRVAGSWIAAIGLLMLGWLARGKG